MCELAKRINLPLTMDFMSVASYEGTASTGHINLKKDLDEPVEGLDVLVVEDIIDSGRTLSHLVKLLASVLRQKLVAYRSRQETSPHNISECDCAYYFSSATLIYIIPCTLLRHEALRLIL